MFSGFQDIWATLDKKPQCDFSWGFLKVQLKLKSCGLQRSSDWFERNPPIIVSVNAWVFYCEIYQSTRVTRLTHLSTLVSSALVGGKKARLEWSPQMEAAFEAALCRATSLAHPDPSAAISLACDASDSHVGAVLQQWSPKGWQPLSFYSKKLDVRSVNTWFPERFI